MPEGRGHHTIRAGLTAFPGSRPTTRMHMGTTRRHAAALAATALAGVILLAGCGKDAADGRTADGEEETVHAVFGIGDTQGDTRATGVSGTDESKVGRWALLLFRDGQAAPVARAVATGSARIEMALPAGTYMAYAVANYPDGGTGAFDPGTVASVSALTGTVSYLSDNAPAGLVMFGSRQVTLSLQTPGLQEIPVLRLAAKIGVDRISIDFSAYPDLAAKTFTVKRIYATNVCSRSAFGSDPASAEASRSLWYNTMGWMTSGSCTSPACPQALLGDTSVGATVTASSPYERAHYFYVYPNPTPAGGDSRAAAWSARCTRIVIEADLGGTTYYYPITVGGTGGLRRNNAYVAANAVIRNVGSTDPEGDSPGAMDVEWSASVLGWNDVTVNEES